MEALQSERHPRAKNIVEYNFQQTKQADMTALATEYKALKRQEEAIKAQLDELKATMIGSMNGEEVFLTDLYKISYKTFTSNRLDTDTFKAVHPDIYTLFCKTSTSTRFTID